jgi:hypothetical protein
MICRVCKDFPFTPHVELEVVQGGTSSVGKIPAGDRWVTSHSAALTVRARRELRRSVPTVTTARSVTDAPLARSRPRTPVIRGPSLRYRSVGKTFSHLGSCLNSGVGQLSVRRAAGHSQQRHCQAPDRGPLPEIFWIQGDRRGGRAARGDNPVEQTPVRRRPCRWMKWQITWKC